MGQIPELRSDREMLTMAKISPSILSADFARLGEDCKSVLDAGADMIHFDVMDGHFVDNISFGIPVLKSLHKSIPDAVYDVHLMISHPLAYNAEFAKAGADFITFHLEADDDIQQTIDAIHACGCKAGLSIKPNTPAEALFPWLEQIEMILVMSVEPGRGGQAFLPSALDKLRILRQECDRRELAPYLSVDGGINHCVTGPQCVQAGADLLVAGSALFGAADRTKVIQAIHRL